MKRCAHFVAMSILVCSMNISNAASLLYATEASASRTHSSTNTGALVDCDENSAWNAGGYAPVTISAKMPDSTKPIAIIRLIPAQTPAGNTTHEIQVSNDESNWRTVDTINEYTKDKQAIVRTFNPPLTGVKKIRVITKDTPSWVAWYEIQAYSSDSEMKKGCRPTAEESIAEMKTDIFTGAVRSVPTSDNLDFSSVTAQVVWTKSTQPKNTDDVRYDPKTNLYWGPVFERYNGKNYKEFLSRPPLSGQRGWELPSAEAVMKSGVYSELKAIYARKYSDCNFTINGCLNYSVLVSDQMGLEWHGDGYRMSKCRGYAVVKMYTSDQKSNPVIDVTCSVGSGNESFYIVPMRQPSAFEEAVETIKASDKSPAQKMSELASYLMALKQTITIPVLQAPSAPQPLNANRLEKGEFETSDALQKRTDAEIERVRIANETAQRNYDEVIKRYQAEVAAQQRQIDEQKQHNKTPEVMSSTLSSALSEAMAMLYGDPALSDLKYDADKQTFSGIVKGEKGGTHAVEFAVPLDKAAQVKAQINDSSLIPSLTFNAKGAELTFAKLDIVENPIILQRDFDSAKTANTIAAYENFISQHSFHPDLPEVSQAKRILADLQLAAHPFDFDNSVGVFTDKRTGLMWRRCAIGRTWDSGTQKCTGNSTRGSWNKAVLTALNFKADNYSDWRLPSAEEFSFLIKEQNANCDGLRSKTKDLFKNFDETREMFSDAHWIADNSNDLQSPQNAQLTIPMIWVPSNCGLIYGDMKLHAELPVIVVRGGTISSAWVNATSHLKGVSGKALVEKSKKDSKEYWGGVNKKVNKFFKDLNDASHAPPSTLPAGESSATGKQFQCEYSCAASGNFMYSGGSSATSVTTVSAKDKSAAESIIEKMLWDKEICKGLKSSGGLSLTPKAVCRD